MTGPTERGGNSLPLVSVGLPVFNGGRYLGEALRSIQAQNHPRLEIVISDNASTDETPEICRAAARQDSRIRYERNPLNIGPLANYCRVVERARGEYFLWAADDDERDPQYVSRLVAALEQNDQAVLATGTTHYCNPAGHPAAMPPCPPAPGTGPKENIATFFDHHADGWFYGVYRREWLAAHVHQQQCYPVWGGDLLWLASIVLRNPVIGDPRAVLRKRVKPSRYQPRTWLACSAFRLRMLRSLTAICLWQGPGLETRLWAWSKALRWYYRTFIRRGSWLRSAYRGVRLTALDLLLCVVHATRGV